MATLRVGLISAASYGYMHEPRILGSSHGTGFATALNGFNPSARDAWTGTFEPASRRIPGARVVSVWDPVREAADRLAELCDIDRVCGTAEEACEGVDAVMIVDDGSGEQWRYATHPLELGIATFCDKPLAMTANEARTVASMARRSGAKLMSGSSLRFVPEILRLRDDLPSLGEVHLVSVACHNELMYYGVHALSMAYALFGAGAVSCINVGRPELNILRVRFGSKRDVVVMVGEQSRMSPGYQISVFGSRGWRTVSPDLTDAYSNLVQAFVDYLVSGTEPFPVEEEVEIIAALEAGKRSFAESREVSLAEMFDPTTSPAEPRSSRVQG